MQNISFTNEIGQTINPGNNIIAVTMSSKTLRTRQGTFLGMTDNGKRCIVEVLARKCVYTFKDNGQETTWNRAYTERKATGREYEIKWVKRPCKIVLFNNLVYAVK